MYKRSLARGQSDSGNAAFSMLGRIISESLGRVAQCLTNVIVKGMMSAPGQLQPSKRRLYTSDLRSSADETLGYGREGPIPDV
jgi:hypothetical protein